MFPYLLVSVLLGSCYCSKEGSMTLGRPELFGPSVALLNDVGVFNCHLTIYPKNETILLELFKEGNRNKLLGFYTSSDGQAASFPIVIQTFHEGNLECVARAQNNSLLEPSVSYTHNLKVIDVVSNPDISFNVMKKESNDYFAVVTCQSTRGTLPITFSLYNKTELAFSMTAEERKVKFKVPLVLDRHLTLQCQANNSDEVAYSRWLPLQVVSVGGPVVMHYDFDIEQNYAVIGLRFYCKATKGTHPRFQWFLNQTLLQDRGKFYYVVNQPPDQSILLLSVGSSSAGTYYCEVADIFDNTTAISSNKQYIDKKELNELPIPVVAVVFGCFTFLVVLVSACCFVGVLSRRRKSGEDSLVSQMMETFSANEDELDMSEYTEDNDVVRSARRDDLDWVSETSADDALFMDEPTDEH
ncbi:uncharacterized protein si:dkey-93h22.7 isoform X2 [Syngnathus typhle]|uniref:uncharacterized protein si:dkey-93h22.7 isoform X2 n=1 Tax=Syngnathus typhle TaxID=161592 RepID=UPI002A69E6A3|nr:uncharacterized protein si:dkey-93h22.7 isoform X2 [Syngnathus typhle]